MYKQGMTWVIDGRPGECTESWKKQLDISKSSSPKDIIMYRNRQEVFQTIHGKGAQPPSSANLGREHDWNTAYTNMDNAFIDPKECIQIYYDRCLKMPSIVVKCGVPVKNINVTNGKATGVLLEDGSFIGADHVIVAAGSWSNKLVHLENLATTVSIAVAWIKVTPEEEAKWKNMSITTNLTTGLNLFPPYRGEIKVLRRLGGYLNTVELPHPEDPSKTIRTSYPRTPITNPSDVIPAEAEAQIRDNLREIMPMIADRPFDRTRLCW